MLKPPTPFLQHTLKIAAVMLAAVLLLGIPDLLVKAAPSAQSVIEFDA